MSSYVTIMHMGAQEQLALLEELEWLRQEGEVSAESLLDAARPINSRLHGLFEWDETVAAERYRLEQARLYIAEIEYVPAEVRPPLLVEMPVARSQERYVNADCLTGVDLTMCSIDRCQREIDDLRKRYGNCSALAGVMEELAMASQEATRAAMALDDEPTAEELAEMPALAARRA